MSFFSAIRVALAALLVNKGRSALTSLGIIIGISAVIAMVSAGNAAHQKLDDRLASVGKNLILIKPGSRNQLGITGQYTPLKREDADALRNRLGKKVIGVAESQMSQRIVSARKGSHLTWLVGSTPDLQKIRGWTVAHGRFYTDDDLKKGAPVCLIGKTVKDKLFDQKNPVGEKIQVGDKLQLTVVGILGEKGRAPTGADQDDQVFLPITTMERKLTGDDRLALIIASTPSEQSLKKTMDDINGVLRERHHLKPRESVDFDVSSVQEMAELADFLAKTMQWLIAVIASISLVVGGIGIMNIMLVSVTERTREIGIRMAVGATPADVLIQFLIEAVVLALVGGIIGVSLGLLGAFAVGRLLGWEVVIDPGVVTLAFGVAAAVGIFFGYYPALKASRLDPIEALRYE